MQFIVVSRRHSRPRSITLNPFYLLPLALLAATLLTVVIANWAASSMTAKPHLEELQAWRAEMAQQLVDQKAEVDKVKRSSAAQVEALAVRTAQLQSRLLRLDAVAERLAVMAKLDNSEFDFSAMPAVGGPDSASPVDTHAIPGLDDSLNALVRQIELREQQLSIMENLLQDRTFSEEVLIAGRPVKKGWMSSQYGYRTDPFKGRKAWHQGVDFAGKAGSEIIAVASGVVTWADKRSGYGNLVEISHARGFTTRYGHN
ncbi:MAG: M23 family metallopeptidase, partial [Pseudomonadales bacterium]